MRKVRSCQILFAVLLAGAGCASHSSRPTLCACLTGAGPTSDAQDPEHRGFALLTLGRTAIGYSIESPGLERVVATHIHHGTAGTNGPMVWEINSGYQGDRIRGEATGFPPGVIALIAADPGEYYVKLHSLAYPGGAIRGQLEPCSSKFNVPGTK
jgi:CHRD domain